MKVGDLVKRRSFWGDHKPLGMIVRFRNGYVCVAWLRQCVTGDIAIISEHREDLEVLCK